MKIVYLILFWVLFLSSLAFAEVENPFNIPFEQLSEEQVMSLEGFKTFKISNNQVFVIFEIENAPDEKILYSCIPDEPQSFRDELCEDGKLKSTRIVKTYDFPSCDARFFDESILTERDYCSICPSPIILSDWSELTTLDTGQTVFVRSVKSFVDNDCRELIVNQVSVDKSGEFLGGLNSFEISFIQWIAIMLFGISGLLLIWNQFFRR